mmetsp:Transcript_34433/g.83796  ORF Transcript_34433/g.83796 Transcript_34433/m.83796 type:complete len:207 (-) Transcript_34433:248-868(-)
MSVTSHGTFLSRLLLSARRVSPVVSMPSRGIDWMSMPERSRVREDFESYMRARYSRVAAVPLETTSVGGVLRLELPRSSSTRLVRVPSLGGSMVKRLPPQWSSTSDDIMQMTGGSCVRPLPSTPRWLRRVKCTRERGRVCRLFLFMMSCSRLLRTANSGGSSMILFSEMLSSRRAERANVSTGTVARPTATRSRMPFVSASSKRAR